MGKCCAIAAVLFLVVGTVMQVVGMATTEMYTIDAGVLGLSAHAGIFKTCITAVGEEQCTDTKGSGCVDNDYITKISKGGSISGAALSGLYIPIAACEICMKLNSCVKCVCGLLSCLISIALLATVASIMVPYTDALDCSSSLNDEGVDLGYSFYVYAAGAVLTISAAFSHCCSACCCGKEGETTTSHQHWHDAPDRSREQLAPVYHTAS